MKKFICLTVHTERLHSDFLWEEIKKQIKFFNKLNVKATWFCVNPNFVGYKFDEKKWIERIKFLAEQGQDIQQHTHFYLGKEGVLKGVGYDFGQENVKKRLLEDKHWLEKNIEIAPKGFVSGAWKMNSQVKDELKAQGYEYDLTNRREERRFLNDFMEIPTLFNLKAYFLSRRKFVCLENFCFSTIYFHDFDLEKPIFRIFLKIFILYSRFFGYKFISASELYDKIKDINSSTRP